MLCNICKTKKLKGIKGTDLKGSINRFCLSCKTKHKVYISNLIRIETNKQFLKDNETKTLKENAEIEQQQNQKIPFNCWIIQERQNEKKFLKQQSNKDFLAEQFKTDLNEFVKAEQKEY